jgi:hypothetical protein
MGLSGLTGRGRRRRVHALPTVRNYDRVRQVRQWLATSFGGSVTDMEIPMNVEEFRG